MGNCVKGMEHMLEMMWQCIVDSESSIDRKKKDNVVITCYCQHCIVKLPWFSDRVLWITLVTQASTI